MQETTNYRFKKIGLDDSPPDITATNPNWDEADRILKEHEEGIETLNLSTESINEQLGDMTQVPTTSKTVEGSITELFTDVSNGKSLVGGAITGVDDSVVIPAEPTFSELAIAIGQISTGKKWASGSGYYPKSQITVSGLEFKPSIIIVSLIAFDTTRSLYRIYAEQGLLSILNKIAINNVPRSGVPDTYAKVLEVSSLQFFTVNNDGFSVNAIGSTATHEGEWIAFE